MLPKPGEDEIMLGIIQNLSANNVYVLESSSQDVTQGIKLVATTGACGFMTFEQLFLVADGATSDVRVWYVIMSKKAAGIGFFLK